MSCNILSVSGEVGILFGMTNDPWTEFISIWDAKIGIQKASNFVTIPSGENTVKVIIILKAGASVKLQSIKLEMGPVSTLANDPPPNPQQELAKCQRYYRVVRNTPRVSILWSGSYKNTIFFDQPMRATPALTLVVGNSGFGDIGLITNNQWGFHWGATGSSTSPSSVYLAEYAADANL